MPMQKLAGTLLALSLIGCASNNYPLPDKHRTNYLPSSGPAQMGSYGVGGTPLSRVTGSPGDEGYNQPASEMARTH